MFKIISVLVCASVADAKLRVRQDAQVTKLAQGIAGVGLSHSEVFDQTLAIKLSDSK